MTTPNQFGGAEEELANVAVYSYQVTGTALEVALPNVTGLTTAYVAGTIDLVWTAVTDWRAPDYEVRQGPSWATAQLIDRTTGTQLPSYGDGLYWVAAHYRIPSSNVDIYSPVPVSVQIAGAQLLSNVVAGYDEAGTGWTGSLISAAVIGGAVELTGTGNILTEGNVLAVTDVWTYGGVSSSGLYHIPAGHIVNIGRSAACTVAAIVAVRGQSTLDNVLATTNELTVTDVLGQGLGAKVDATVQIRISTDGVNWGSWQNWAPGQYTGQMFDFQVVLSSLDPTVNAILSHFSFQVTAPTRVDAWSLAVPTTGSSVLFASGLQGNPAANFNGGPNNQSAPIFSWAVINGAAGDTPVLTPITAGAITTGFTIQVFNAGIAVARTVHVMAQGY